MTQTNQLERIESRIDRPTANGVGVSPTKGLVVESLGQAIAGCRLGDWELFLPPDSGDSLNRIKRGIS